MGATRKLPPEYDRFFRALGYRIRGFRMERKLTQEDMISFGFSVRHWQMIEAGRPMTVFTILRICESFDVTPELLLADLGRQFLRLKK
jgi:hypothetical protein